MTASPRSPVDRQAISRDLETSRRLLHELLVAGTGDLRRRSDGTRWTNEQLLFHMVFGFMVVRVLLRLVRLLGRLPATVGGSFAAVLDSARRPFDVVNYWGSRGAALVFDHARMGWICDRTITALQRHLAGESEDSLHRGMAFPTSWDPYFAPHMTLADVYRYPTRHFEHHRRQLTLRPGTGST
ncbi:DinB family protein [Blastococcus sp. CT_GayMR16]|uniref:DinB family protein n=1 Tax=Blastococcus sp. CT_GayMR16 TaxID=2559607 RepID=UPI001ADDB1A0|nr:DinB family protein [Blastococcus sp. CT_GayMR16]